ncbi:hypothetical protein BS78_05G059500 [Paspalum vaginatum]|nr:hypothetical protein BS78_05G059500 [Paspalum vaginatum]
MARQQQAAVDKGARVRSTARRGRGIGGAESGGSHLHLFLFLFLFLSSRCVPAALAPAPCPRSSGSRRALLRPRSPRPRRPLLRPSARPRRRSPRRALLRLRCRAAPGAPPAAAQGRVAAPRAPPQAALSRVNGRRAGRSLDRGSGPCRWPLRAASSRDSYGHAEHFFARGARLRRRPPRGALPPTAALSRVGLSSARVSPSQPRCSTPDTSVAATPPTSPALAACGPQTRRVPRAQPGHPGLDRRLVRRRQGHKIKPSLAMATRRWRSPGRSSSPWWGKQCGEGGGSGALASWA